MITASEVAALDAGAAWFEDDGRATLGTVCGVFPRAAYLRFGERIVALCRADVASGPLHLRLPDLPQLALGAPAVFETGRLDVGSATIAVPPDRRWSPPALPMDALARMGGRRHLGPGCVSCGPEKPAPRCGDVVIDGTGALVVGLDRALVDRAEALIAARALETLARLLGGRGPGLTPAGDDLLAGVLVIDALRHPADLALRRAAAGAAVTTDVAAAFLRWAAVGQCIEPFHAVLSAMADGEPQREAQARAALRATGASSGDALLLGLDLALSAA